MHDKTAMIMSPDPSLNKIVGDLVRAVPHLHPLEVASLAEARARAERDDIAIVLLHHAEGAAIGPIADWVQDLAERPRPVPTVVIGEEHRAEQAVALLRRGAADYLNRPLDLNRLAYLLDVMTLRARHAVSADPAVVRAESDGEPFLHATTGTMGRLMEQVRKVAPSDATILLGGETGTGKTRLARVLHGLSRRDGLPFLAINCGALSATLIESEMFGHVKGAFTGADRDRTGKFAEVGRGTLFLDEIDSLPPALQAKLLRAVEERVFEPVGSNASLNLGARLIAASNRPLEQEVQAGRFRADLFYRLNVISFTIPPLRERSLIIPELARTFAAEFAAVSLRPSPAIDPQVLRVLEAYPWPGNIRELRNVIERGVALCHEDRITLDDLPDSLRAAVPAPADPAPDPATPAKLAQVKDTAELTRIHEALTRHANNRLQAAAELGISRVTLYKKLHKYGLMPSLG